MATKKKLPAGFTQRTDGRLQLSFTMEGKRYTVYGKTVRECRDKEIAKRQRIADGLVRNDNITLKKYFDEWIEARRGTVKESTLYAQRSGFKRVLNLIGDRKLKDIEKRDVVQVQKVLSENLSTSTVNDVLVTLKSVLNSAVNDRIIAWNPAASVKGLKRTEPEATKNIHRALTEQEQQLFFQYAKTSYYYNFFRMLLMTGCRTGEIAALTWSDIDRKNNVIHINKTVTKTSDKDYTIGTPKTKSSIRTIPLTADVVDVLKSQMEINAAMHRKIVGIDNRIFVTLNGTGYIKPQNLIRVIKSVLEDVKNDTGQEIEYFSPHAFRDTFATRCIEQGMNPQTLKTLLGHSSLSMTMDRYAQVLDSTREKEMNLVKFAI